MTIVVEAENRLELFADFNRSAHAKEMHPSSWGAEAADFWKFKAGVVHRVPDQP